LKPIKAKGNPDMPNDILPILEFDELVELLDYIHARAARRAIQAGTFPIPVFEFAGRTVAHVDAVELYFKEMRDNSMTWLKNRYGMTEEDAAIATSPRIDLYRKQGQKQRKA
jgi:hypothetical protein